MFAHWLGVFTQQVFAQLGEVFTQCLHSDTMVLYRQVHKLSTLHSTLGRGFYADFSTGCTDISTECAVLADRQYGAGAVPVLAVDSSLKGRVRHRRIEPEARCVRVP